MVGIVLALMTTLGAGRGEARSVLYVNGVIWTGDPAQPWASAIWVDDSAIRGVGQADALALRAGFGVRHVDLNGSFVCPGLIDAHAHVLGLGLSLERVDLVGAASLEETLSRVRGAVASRSSEADGWVQGRGWDQNDWSDPKFPTAADLDEISGAVPVALTRIDGHALWVNHRALELAGIGAETEDPPGGKILRDTTSAPTGILVDEAMNLVTAVIPETESATKARAILRATETLVRAGITGVHDMGMSAEELAVYRDLAGDEKLGIRIYGAISSEDPDLEEVLKKGPDRGWTKGTFKLGMVKFYVDGALGSRGAALLEPYSDDPGNQGLLVMGREQLGQELRRALGAGFQCAVHAIGDRANRAVLDTWEEIIRKDMVLRRGHAVPIAPLSLAGGVNAMIPPIRLEHAQIVHPDDLPRFGGLGVVASVQPTHCTSDMPWVPDRLGPGRLAGAYAWRSLIRNGAVLAAGSDFPVESYDPRLGLYAAVTRRPPGDPTSAGWSPGERLSRDEAMAAFTAVPAYLSGDLHNLGTITLTKQADFVVLDRNLVTCDPEEILEARVLLTVVGGEPLWVDPEAPFAAQVDGNR